MTMTHPRPLPAVAFVAAFLAAVAPGFTLPARATDEPAYKPVRGFPQLPPGLKLGAVSGVAVDRKDNVLVFHRGEPKKPILVFDRDGGFLRAFGDGLFDSTHGLRVDSDGASRACVANAVPARGGGSAGYFSPVHLHRRPMLNAVRRKPTL